VILPSALLPPTTESVGYFACPGPALAEWLVAELGPPWRSRRVDGGPLRSLVEQLRPGRGRRLSRYLLLPLDGWTAMLNDASLGTDLGVLPSLAARRLGCRAMRAVAARPGQHGTGYPATILEVYDPAATGHPLRARRTISAADDGGTWRFDQSGEPFPFEDEQAYTRPLIGDRFTPELLERYLEQLGIPAGDRLGGAVDTALAVDNPTLRRLRRPRRRAWQRR
jgi:hypothetical protein